jgi:hypothetical protein
MIALVLLGLLVLLGVAAVLGAVVDTRDSEYGSGRVLLPGPHRDEPTRTGRPAPVVPCA